MFRKHRILSIRLRALFYRIGLAVGWAVRMQLAYFRIRRRLRMKVGNQWLNKRLPRFKSESLVWSSVQLLSKAIRPECQTHVTARTQRLDHILALLKTIKRGEYAINTVAGERVFRAAMARCLQAICDDNVEPTQLELLPCNTGLAATLIRWLERAGVDNSEVTTALQPTIGWQSMGFCPETLSVTDDLDTIVNMRQANRQEQQAAIDRIAEQELRSFMMDQQLKHLALPTAILHTLSQNGSAKR